jgi:hypothetical protein
MKHTPVAAGGSLKNSAANYVVKNRLVAKMEAKKKMEKGPPERLRQLLSGFWTFSLSTTFPKIPSLRSYSLTSLEGEEEQRKIWRNIRFLGFLSLHDFSRKPVFLGEVEPTPIAASGSLKNSAGKNVVGNRLVANVQAKKRMGKGPPERQGRLLSDFSWNHVFLGEVEQTPAAACSSLKNSAGRCVVRSCLGANVEAMVQNLGIIGTDSSCCRWLSQELCGQVRNQEPSGGERGEGEARKRWRDIRFLDFLSFHNFSRNPVFAVLLAHVFEGGGGGDK